MTERNSSRLVQVRLKKPIDLWVSELANQDFEGNRSAVIVEALNLLKIQKTVPAISNTSLIDQKEQHYTKEVNDMQVKLSALQEQYVISINRQAQFMTELMSLIIGLREDFGHFSVVGREVEEEIDKLDSMAEDEDGQSIVPVDSRFLLIIGLLFLIWLILGFWLITRSLGYFLGIL